MILEILNSDHRISWQHIAIEEEMLAFRQIEIKSYLFVLLCIFLSAIEQGIAYQVKGCIRG